MGFIATCELPVYSRLVTSMAGTTQRLGVLNEPVTCGGVIVQPGDFIVADTIGVAVVPLAKAEEIVALAEEQGEREQKTREWVAQGKTVEDLLKEFGRI